MKNLLFKILFMTTPLIGLAQTNYQHQTLTIFKNGLVYLEKSTEVAVESQQALLYPLPFSSDNDIPIVMGSLQLKAAQNTINELNFTRQNVGKNKEQYYDNLAALFKNNIGAKISVSTKEYTVEGVLKNFINDSYGKLMIGDGKKIHFVLMHNILSVNFMDNSQASVDKEKDGDWVYDLKFAKNNKKQALTISYLQKGMTWLPNYYLDFGNDNTATLKLEATLINDIEDFENAAVNLAVGFSSFHFSNIESPLTNKAGIANNLSGYGVLNERESSRNYKKLGQSLSANISQFTDSYDPSELPENANQEDLYFFKKESLSAKKGSRIMVPIFETKINYKDVYKVRLQPNLDNYGKYNAQQDQKNYVTHHIEFKNETGFPFTTGSILYRKKSQDKLNFLAQGELKYTAAAAKASPEMTVSADIRVLEKDKEISRKEMHDQYNRAYYVIHVEGTIEITNFKPEAIAMEIEKRIGGTLEKSSTKWTYQTEVSKDKNPQNEVTWKLEAAAGKTTKIVYYYTYLSN